LGGVFRSILKRYNLSPGDFPNIHDFQGKLAEIDFSTFSVLKQPLVDTAEHALSIDIPRLMEALPRSIDPTVDVQMIAPTFDGQGKSSHTEDENPFGDEPPRWFLSDLIPVHQDTFNANQQGGFITGAKARELLTATGIPVSQLRKLWDLSDISKDGKLDLYEYIIAMYLTSEVAAGRELPVSLDPQIMPPK
jgi:EH domain-containing protein 1